jgi:hypothetical protein
MLTIRLRINTIQSLQPLHNCSTGSKHNLIDLADKVFPTSELRTQVHNCSAGSKHNLIDLADKVFPASELRTQVRER